MEACFVNLVEPGDTAIIGVNGVFGERMCEVARRVRRRGRAGRHSRGAARIDPQQLLDAQRPHPHARLVAVVHAETSTGVENEIAPLAALQHTDTLLLVDTVTSLGGIPVEVDAWGIDAVLLRHAEVPRRSARSLADQLLGPCGRSREGSRAAPPQSWYLDLGLIADYVGSARRYHHTAPISMLYALHAGLGVLLDEGLDASHARHAHVGGLLQDALPELGFRALRAGPAAPAAHVGVAPRGGRRCQGARRAAHRFDIEVGGGLGELAGKGWRIGLMGHSAREHSVVALLGALHALL